VASVPTSSPSAFHALARRWVLGLALAAALGPLLAHFAINARSTLVLIQYPFGMDYGEGIVWQQMRNIMHGQGYAPLGTYPAIVYHYPPVFHVTVAFFAWLFGTDELGTGRAVSWISTLGTAALLGRLAVSIGAQSKDRVTAWLGGLLTALMFLSCEPVVIWSPLMRVDMLACLLSVGGLAFALRAIDRPGLLHAAALCFTLAVYTKQTSIAAPAAAFLGLLAVRPRLAAHLTIVTVGQSAIILAVLSWATDGNFLRHIILYNVNRVDPAALASLAGPILQHAIYVALAFAGAFLLIRRNRSLWQIRQDHVAAVAGTVAAIAYFVIKILMLPMVMKSGASFNYMIEWFCSVAILAGIATLPALRTVVAHFREQDIRPDASIALPCAVLLAVAVQTAQLPRVVLTPQEAAKESAQVQPAVDLIRHSTKPVISDDMTLLIRAGHPVDWEPAIAAELGATGRYDQAGFVRMIREKRFGLFLTEGKRGEYTYDSRYNPPVADAIASAYPREYALGRFTVHAPER
jgi:hypothetical protein